MSNVTIRILNGGRFTYFDINIPNNLIPNPNISTTFTVISFSRIDVSLKDYAYYDSLKLSNWIRIYDYWIYYTIHARLTMQQYPHARPLLSTNIVFLEHFIKLITNKLRITED